MTKQFARASKSSSSAPERKGGNYVRHNRSNRKHRKQNSRNPAGEGRKSAGDRQERLQTPTSGRKRGGGGSRRSQGQQLRGQGFYRSHRGVRHDPARLYRRQLPGLSERSRGKPRRRHQGITGNLCSEPEQPGGGSA